LQDIISWMMETFDWYRLNEKTGWEVFPFIVTCQMVLLTAQYRSQSDIIFLQTVPSGR
jgi:hypothetical protein